ncbi:hypothetical protein CYLTODRAFT_427528 [Cylindrobasidium torrendii FP15055 ss-10]|uniref:Uncharacterized protein n=1 Tax=Cylindrobasidium torrendii FP15055 ss-10 TaxID=1314674 RepID=A0A0D7ASW4_9AGAR|nr:hypothetical protein CYLTODRAFT_427528 [Cylindrobasidium torrendii FP15055 ss-10]
MEEWRDSYAAPVTLARRASRLHGMQDVAVEDVNSLEVFTVGHYIRAFYGVFKRPPTAPSTLLPQTQRPT